MQDLGFKIAYFVLLLLIAVFLYELGKAPWILVLDQWPVLTAVMLSTGTGLIVQAQSFRFVFPRSSRVPRLKQVTNIWAVAALSSVVAPLFSGVATRTALLIRAGASLDDCITTSGRQFWLGIEFSLLLGALSFPLTDVPYASIASVGLAIAWAIFLFIRWQGAARLDPSMVVKGRISRMLWSLRGRVEPAAYVWYILQILAMSATYFLGFNGLGASLSVPEAVALSSLTVVLSVIIFVPNGLGFVDAAWIYIATHAGLTLQESVAIALCFRMAHFFSSAVIFVSTGTRKAAKHRRSA